MTLTIEKKSNILLTYTVVTNNAIDLEHDGELLHDHGDEMFVEIAQSAPPSSVTIMIGNAATAEVHAWTDTPSGMVAWDRARSACEAEFSSLDHDVLVVHVPRGVDVPSPTSSSGPPAPGTSQTLLHVQVKAQGSLPL